MANTKPFNAMTIEERGYVLTTLGKTLHFSATIAKHHGDPIWKPLKKLGDRVLADFAEIACDASDQADAVILEAIELLGRCELDRPRGTLH